MPYQGSCHCGRIAFEVEVEGEIPYVVQCNCSICRRRGSLLWFVPRSQFRLATPEADYATYRFNKMHIAHHFCPVCGVAPFADGTDKEGKAMAAVNVRCLDDVDLAALKVVDFDGRSM